MESNVRQFEAYYKKKKLHSIKKSLEYARKELSQVILLFAFTYFAILGLLNMITGKYPGKEVDVTVFSHIADITGMCVFYDNCNIPDSKEDLWVMYNSLSVEDKNVYNMFLDLAENRSGEAYKSAIIVSHDRLNELGKKHFWYVYSAMRRDHPEYFYLSTDPDTIACNRIDLKDYAVFVFTMKDTDFSEEIAAFDKAVNEFMADIDLEASDLDIELQIHDKLIDLVSYDSGSPLTPDVTTADPRFTAYGALVCNSKGEPNSAVCSGYALAFEHLLHLAGIPCGYISGEVIGEEYRGSGQLGHAWNVVRINGDWYEVDTTWDDMAINQRMNQEFYESLIKDDEKFYNWRHHYFNRASSEMKSLKPSDATLFEVEGYQPYNPIRDTSHIRSKEVTDTASETDVFLNTLVPVGR